MITNYVKEIKAKVDIYSAKKTTNVFDGSYKSVFKGNGMNFEDLREYVPGDEISSIDWKATSRSGTVLVKRYMAEKKHNIMLIFDSGKKMLADTKEQQTKKDVALYAGGVIGYIAARNGDNISALYTRNNMMRYFPPKTGMLNIEKILAEYDRQTFENSDSDMVKNLDYLLKNVRKRMIIFLISDADGITRIPEDMIKRIVGHHDLLYIQISDADVSDGKAYDIEKNSYIPDFISQNKDLKKFELETKRRNYEENKRKLIRNRVVSTQVDSTDHIVDKIIELLERHKYANNR